MSVTDLHYVWQCDLCYAKKDAIHFPDPQEATPGTLEIKEHQHLCTVCTTALNLWVGKRRTRFLKAKSSEKPIRVR